MCDCREGAPDHWKPYYRRAKKEHKCGECGTVIKPGEKYFYWEGVWSGEWNRGKCCIECDQLNNHLSEIEDCYCPPLGGMHDELSCWGELPRSVEKVGPKLYRLKRPLIEAVI